MELNDAITIVSTKLRVRTPVFMFKSNDLKTGPTVSGVSSMTICLGSAGAALLPKSNAVFEAML